MKVDLFDFTLPESHIALRPCEPREDAKLLHVSPPDGFGDYHLRDLPTLLDDNDVLVFNDTRVIPAQLQGVRQRGTSIAHISATLHMRVAPDSWQAFVKGAKRLQQGDKVVFSRETHHLSAEIVAKSDHEGVTLLFDRAGGDLDAAIAVVGQMPLPPYIAARRGEDDRDKHDYQTVFAREDGAVAAPTAGLHYTPQLLEALTSRGIQHYFVTLHVGAGTFLPVKVDDTVAHKMHSEIGHIDAETAAALMAAKQAGKRIVAVGTTSLRLLESAADPQGQIGAWSGATDIFITPGYQFRFVDRLLTNFHLPRSTLFMLVSAFSGLETMKAAYKHAIDTNYRFYSYGDTSLLERQDLSK